MISLRKKVLPPANWLPTMAVGIMLLYSGLFWYRGFNRETFSRDGYSYTRAIELLANHGWERFFAEYRNSTDRGNETIPPLFPAGAALIYRIVGDAGDAVLIYNYLCGFLFLAGGWLAGMALSDWKWAAPAAALLCALLPSFIRDSSDMLRDGSYMSYVMFGLGSLLYAVNTGSRRMAFAAGIAAAAAIFTRREGGEFFLAILGWLVFECTRARRLRVPAEQEIWCTPTFIFLGTFILIFGGVWLSLMQIPSFSSFIPFSKLHYVWRVLFGN